MSLIRREGMDTGWSSGRRRDGGMDGRVGGCPNIDILVIFDEFLSLSLSLHQCKLIYIKYKLLEAWTHRTDPRLSRLQLNGKEIYNNSDCSEP